MDINVSCYLAFINVCCILCRNFSPNILFVGYIRTTHIHVIMRNWGHIYVKEITSGETFSHNTYLLYSFYTLLSLQSETFPQIDNNKLKVQKIIFFVYVIQNYWEFPFINQVQRGFREHIFWWTKKLLL